MVGVSIARSTAARSSLSIVGCLFSTLHCRDCSMHVVTVFRRAIPIKFAQSQRAISATRLREARKNVVS